MKKFTRIIICLMLCVFSVSLFACDKRSDKEKAFTYPTVADTPYGNDGLAVQMGKYIYFVNGYISSGDEAKHIRYASNHVGGLMLTKLDANGNLVTDANGDIGDEYYISMSDKLCGFEATSLFVSDNYLYFTSTCQEDNDDVWVKNRVDFNRIKLDKSSEVERIFQSEVDNSNLEFKFYNNSLVVWEKGENSDNKKDVKSDVLYRIDLNSKDKAEIARGVSSVVFGANDVFFVKNDSSNKTEPYTLNQLNASSGAHSKFVGYAESVEVKFVESGYVYAVVNSNLRKYNISTKQDLGDVLTDFDFYDKVVIAPETETLIAIGDNIIEFFDNGSLIQDDIFVTDEDTEKVNFIGFANSSVVYYDDDNNIKLVSYSNRSQEIDTVVALDDMETTYFDIDGSYLYYYATVGSNVYLHRIQLDAISPVAEIVGIYLEADIPTVEETEE